MNLLTKTLLLLVTLVPVSEALAQAPKPAPLPAPQTQGGRPLMQALKDRRTTREYDPRPVAPQTLSNLLWAAAGLNRPETGGRTAPSARNVQEIDVYVAKADGVFLYEPRGHALTPVVAEDLRADTGVQPWVKQAPVSLVFVADYARMEKIDAAQRELMAAADAAFVSQNVYLFCASEGLATGVRAMIDRAALGKLLKLRPEQHIVFAQAVGHFRKAEPPPAAPKP